MARIAIGVRVHRNSADAEAARGADHAAGDLAAVGDQDFFEHQEGLRFSRKDAIPSLPSGETRTSAMLFAVSAISASSSGRLAIERMSCFIFLWASGPPASKSLVSFSINGSSSPGETMADKRPILCAS